MSIPKIPKPIPIDSPVVGDLLKDLKHLDQNVKIAMWVLLAIVITAIFALGAIWNDYLAMKQATYADLRDKVVDQNYRIDSLEKELQKNKHHSTRC